MPEDIQQQFDAMQTQIDTLSAQVNRFELLIQQLTGGKPEGLSQLVVSQYVKKTPTAGGVIRVVTTQGEVNILIE